MGCERSDMETLGGFPCLPAMVRAERSSAAPHASDMETLGGFPCLPAMVRAERSSAPPHASGWLRPESRRRHVRRSGPLVIGAESGCTMVVICRVGSDAMRTRGVSLGWWLSASGSGVREVRSRPAPRTPAHLTEARWPMFPCPPTKRPGLATPGCSMISPTWPPRHETWPPRRKTWPPRPGNRKPGPSTLGRPRMPASPTAVTIPSAVSTTAER
jgi:hypothetical protein